MTKQNKTLAWLASAAAALVVYLAATAKLERAGEDGSGPPAPPARTAERRTPGQAELETGYEEAVKEAIAVAGPALAQRAEDGAGAAEAVRLSEAKIALLDLTVPERYRDAHLNFVLALSRAKAAIDEGDESERLAAAELFRATLAENQWLAD